MLSDERLSEFQELYKKEFGIELSKQEALAKAIPLIRIVEIMYEQAVKEHFEEQKGIVKDKE